MKDYLLNFDFLFQVIKSVRLAYIEQSTTIQDRIFYAWTAVFIVRLWCMWINSMKKQDLDLILLQLLGDEISSQNKKSKTKRYFYITYQSFFSIEINAHSLTFLVMLVSEGKLPVEALNIWMQNSQTCESTFRSARAISSTSSAGVNFTVSQFLSRINKLLVLQNIKCNTDKNFLKFPHHHKLSTTITNILNTSNIINLSNSAVETIVHDAYTFVTKLFNPLQMKQILRNGRLVSLEELSKTTVRDLDAFWCTDTDDIIGVHTHSDDESDDDTNSNIGSHYENDSDNDDYELEDDSEINVTMSTNHGMRLYDSVRKERAHTFIKININGEQKFMHKQTACWALEKDKNSLSSDRLSRVQGR